MADADCRERAEDREKRGEKRERRGEERGERYSDIYSGRAVCLSVVVGGPSCHGAFYSPCLTTAASLLVLQTSPS